jgi:hypothetical protein
MKKIFILILVTVLLFSCVGCGNEAEKTTALDYVNAFVNAGLPVENIIEYTEETDVNGLLGRPDQYISKVNFADNRIEQYDTSDPLGGTVEVFESKKNLENRKTYIEQLFETGLGGKQYIYVSTDGLALLRLEFDLTPEQAGEYEKVFIKIEEYLDMEPSAGTTVIETPSLTEEQTEEPTEEPTVEPTEEPTVEPTQTPFNGEEFKLTHNNSHVDFKELMDASLKDVGLDELQTPFMNDNGGYTYKINDDQMYAFTLDDDGNIIEAQYLNIGSYDPSFPDTLAGEEMAYMLFLYAFIIEDAEGSEDFFESIKLRSSDGDDFMLDTTASYGGYDIEFCDTAVGQRYLKIMPSAE